MLSTFPQGKPRHANKQNGCGQTCALQAFLRSFGLPNAKHAWLGCFGALTSFKGTPQTFTADDQKRKAFQTQPLHKTCQQKHHVPNCAHMPLPKIMLLSDKNMAFPNRIMQFPNQTFGTQAPITTQDIRFSSTDHVVRFPNGVFFRNFQGLKRRSRQDMADRLLVLSRLLITLHFFRSLLQDAWSCSNVFPGFLVNRKRVDLHVRSLGWAFRSFLLLSANRPPGPFRPNQADILLSTLVNARPGARKVRLPAPFRRGPRRYHIKRHVRHKDVLQRQRNVAETNFKINDIRYVYDVS